MVRLGLRSGADVLPTALRPAPQSTSRLPNIDLDTKVHPIFHHRNWSSQIDVELHTLACQLASLLLDVPSIKVRLWCLLCGPITINREKKSYLGRPTLTYQSPEGEFTNQHARQLKDALDRVAANIHFASGSKELLGSASGATVLAPKQDAVGINGVPSLIYVSIDVLDAAKEIENELNPICIWSLAMTLTHEVIHACRHSRGGVQYGYSVFIQGCQSGEEGFEGSMIALFGKKLIAQKVTSSTVTTRDTWAHVSAAGFFIACLPWVHQTTYNDYVKAGHPFDLLPGTQLKNDATVMVKDPDKFVRKMFTKQFWDEVKKYGSEYFEEWLSLCLEE